MSRSDKAWSLGLAAYVLIAVATFGNAVVYFKKVGEQDVAQCKVESARPEFCWMYKSDGLLATASTIVWPLYWSYRFAARNDE